jgi:hypothetical protein
MKIKTLVLSFSLGFLPMFSMHANINEEECVFDASSITDDFLKENDEIQAYHWSDDTKTAAVLLKTGEYVFIKKWACIHYGMEAKKITMFPSVEQESIAYWQKDLLSFGQQFLCQGDFELYKSTLEKTNWAQGREKLLINEKYEINIPHEAYPEFFVMLERREDMVVVTLYYYMN